MSDKEKAEYYDMWYEYFEPLARIRREVERALPDAEKAHSGYDEGILTLTREEYIIWWMGACNIETAAEIENLIRMMLTEIEENK